MLRQLTATAFIIQNSQVLLIWHPKHQKWLPPGGHVEEHELAHEAAIREALEETGYAIDLCDWKGPLSPGLIRQPNASSQPHPYLILLENIPSFGKELEHQHLDFIYLARPRAQVRACANHTMRWWSLDQLMALDQGKDIFEETMQSLRTLLVCNIDATLSQLVYN